MASIITSISLDAETMEIKDRVIAHYGFSKFVRMCLHEADAMANPTHTTEEAHRVGGLCNGMRKPVCVICWPEGAPSRAGWKGWVSGDIRAKPSAQKQRIVKAALTESDTDSEGQKAPTSRPAKKGLIRRFIRWIY